MPRSRPLVLPIVAAAAAALTCTATTGTAVATAQTAGRQVPPATGLSASTYTVGRPIPVPTGALVELDPTIPRAYVVTQQDISTPDELAVRVDVAGVDPATRRVVTRSHFTYGSVVSAAAVDTVHHRLLLGFSYAGVAEVDGVTGQLSSYDISGDDGHVDSLVTDPGTGTAYATTERAGADSLLALDAGGGSVTRPNSDGFGSVASDELHGRALVTGAHGLEVYGRPGLHRLDARSADYRLYAAAVDTRTGSAFALDDHHLVRLDTSTGLETGSSTTVDPQVSGGLTLDPGTSTLYVARDHDVAVVDEDTLQQVATIPLTGRLLLDPVRHVLYVIDEDTVTPVTQRPVVPPATGASIRVVTGAGQTQDSGLVFTVPPRVAVTGTDGRPLPGASVRFTVPAGRASFRTPAGQVTTSTVTTAADGSATAPVLVAGPTVGPLQVTASVTVAGSTSTSRLAETVAPSPVASLDTLSPRDEVQAAAVGTRFARPVTVTARDLAARTAAGRPVRFTVDGPATFVGGGTTAVTTTGGGGTATSPPVVAGSSPGPVTVTAVAEQPTSGEDASPHAVVPLSVTPAGPAVADLRVTLSGVPGTADVGSSCGVDVTATNVGTAPVTDGVVVLSLSNRVSIDWPEPGTFDGDGGPVARDPDGQRAHVAVWDLVDGLAPGASVTMSADLIAARAGATSVVARVATGAADRHLADNTATAALTIR